MKYLGLLLLVLLTMNCKEKSENEKPAKEPEQQEIFYLGTYTNGESKGIYKYSISDSGKLARHKLVATTSNPSYLAKDASGRFLLAVNENDQEGTGFVSAFGIDKDSLRFINAKATGGAHPCHISITSNNMVLVANYTGGNLSLFKLEDQGNLSERLDLVQHQGRGTTDRQEAPHAHFVKKLEQTQTIVASDLGTNELWFYGLDSTNSKLQPTKQARLMMNAGGGPRHWAAHPNGKWLFVLNELNAEVQQVSITEDGDFKLGQATSILPEDFSNPNTGADIHISSDGRFLYASNRGHNSIAILEVQQDTGALKLIGHQSTKGDGPRNFSFSPNENFLIVANQHTNNIVSFKRDSDTGLLNFIDQIDAPTPVCILF